MIFKHKRSGGLYEYVSEATEEATMKPLVVYKAVSDGSLWVRPKAEFYDGRFVAKEKLVIYHKGCLDGFSAAYIFKKTIEDCELYAGVYGEPPPDVAGRQVYLVDFSYDRATIEKMLETAESVTLIDHHKTAITELASFNHLKFYRHCSVERSGCMLACEFLGVEPPWFFYYVEDRDLWRFSFVDTKAVTAYLYTRKMDYETYKALDESHDGANKACEIGRVLLERQEKDIASALKLTRHLFIDGYNTPVVNAPGWLSSDIGNILSSKEPFAATYYDTEEHRVFSLRSNIDFKDHVDVSQIAFVYGGGGHKHAAGFRVPRDHELARD